MGWLGRKEAKETAEQVLPESRGAKGVWFSGSQKTEFLEEWNVKYCVKRGLERTSRRSESIGDT